MMRPYFIFSKFPQLIFSPLLLLPPWNWTHLEMRGGADSNCGPRGGASVKKLLIFVFWNICDSYLCRQLCFAFFVISHFVENIETNNFWRFGQSYFPHFFLKNDKEVFCTCLLHSSYLVLVVPPLWIEEYVNPRKICWAWGGWGWGILRNVDTLSLKGVFHCCIF